MAPRSKITKRLYRRLRERQILDIPLTAPGCVEIKSYLKNHSRCAHVLVEGTPEPLHISTATTLSSDIPLFLTSQVQAQKAIADDSRPSVQLSAILHFASQHLARVPTKTGFYPTLFHWKGQDTRRSYCLFAYLTTEMARYKYTADELLQLRCSQPSQVLLDRVKLNPDLGKLLPRFKWLANLSIFCSVADVLLTLLEDVLKQHTIHTVQPRRLKKAKDEAMSSTDSEEHIVFQGKKQGRQPIGNSDGQTEWKYMARSASERTSNEPVAAPTGLDAQQNEGFQRFFKAVVSPTHVRVTAGGRIVPNTRSATSPTAKWDKERSTVESDNVRTAKPASSENTAASNGQPTVPPFPSMMMPPMTPAMYPGFHPMLPPLGAPMPFFPIPHGMPIPYGVPQPNPQPISGMSAAVQNPVSQDKQDENAKAMQPEATQEATKTKPAPLKISPPDQFDHSRPYFFNGNVFYPGCSPLPIQSQATPLTPSPYLGGFVNPAIARFGGFGQPSPMLPLSSPNGLASPAFSSSLMAGAPHPLLQSTQPTLKPAGVMATSTAPKPPITSIKPSDITKSQLSSLRSQLKYYDDQMQYNKHQIDEKATLDQMQTISRLIAQFENNYQAQINVEKTLYPNGETGRPATAGLESTHCKTPSTPTLKDDDGKSQTGSIKSAKRSYPALNHTQSMDQIRHKTVKDLRQRAGINSSKGNDTTSALGALEAHIQQKRLADPSKKPTLPTRAAMAPVFEPSGTAPTLPSNAPGDLGSVMDARQTSNSLWEHSRMPSLSPSGLWTGTNNASAVLPSHAPRTAVSKLSTPYLVGKLPQGVNPSSARANDYVYSRELTEEEKRARHVYWGGVSSQGSGLPKFDGKDFYPASPMKAQAKGDSKIHVASKWKPDPIPTGNAEVEYDQEVLKKSDDPFRSYRDAESIRSTKSSRKLSRAVPIINPDTGAREEINTAIRTTKRTGSPATAGSGDLRMPPRDTQSSPAETAVVPTSEKKLSAASRRTLNRSSKGSSNDLWQSMMKKGSTSGSAVPSEISSTTATGYLPQALGNAAASLSPAVTNVNGSPRAASGGKANQDIVAQHCPTEKMGENRPPRELSSHADIIADLHQRMLRDAERRGVIGPGWQ
ncbi:uncharacterized protein JN550_002958 [Neoarthrinium moseri]|uniref:uncharacterized protein n=1 Tax=Neoarthrinium moseri TaxID=1658444 RepID=UPI001FDC9765|nr:uncharacterized protein JN550_002958 [Neoarthrinium moseri]KAI1873689.1 hypothetical protein JN550_002958 [Neoarthrinium moseri]